MQWAHAKHKRLLASLAALSLFIVPMAASANQPYFKTFGSDVMSGGWFASGTSCDTSPSGPYQDPNYSNKQDARAGGIMTYEASGKGGASSQYAAFSLGQVEGNSSLNYGFYSAGNLAGQNKLTFANTTTYGGNFEGANRQSSCIPDYYHQKIGATTTSAMSDGAFPGGSGAYAATAGSTPFAINSGNVSIPAGSKITIFIKGNAYIGHNITYASDTVDNATKFALVVLGNIYIDPSVSQLDGLYIAQPATNNVGADDGAIWTCHDQSTTNPLQASYIISACGNKLTVNGALVAKQVNFLRTKGDVSAAKNNEDSLAGANASDNIAEIINYTPEMIVGGPFFNSTNSTSFRIESLTSLPPLF